MNILILSATGMEIAPARDASPPVAWLEGGVGVPSTIFRLTSHLHSQPCDLVIQAGIAGVFGNRFGLGETVLVENDCFADLGIAEKGKLSGIFDMGFADANEFPFLDSRLPNDHPILQEQQLPLAKAVTVNLVSDDPARSRLLQERYPADIESMEGAALHYVCRQMKVPFLQLRSISNVVGERDKSKWLMKEAIGNLNRELLQLIHRFIPTT